MPFKKTKRENELLKIQVSTTITKDTSEVWNMLCRSLQTSSHKLLRQLVEDYCRQNGMRTRDPYTVLSTLRR